MSSSFTGGELSFLRGGERRLARLATVGANGLHVAPVGYAYNEQLDTIDIEGARLERTKKFRDVQHDQRVALVVDDVLTPWFPLGVEVRGWAEAVSSPQPLIRVHPERIVSWGIESDEITDRHARTVTTHPRPVDDSAAAK